MQTKGLSILFAGGLLALIAHPALAINVQQMKQRINNSTTGGPVGLVKTAAEKAVCKADRKPICFAEGAFIDGNYAIAKVTRPEDDKAFFVIFQLDGSWKALYARDLKLLSLSKLKLDKVRIPDPVATRLIQKMQALR